VTAWLSISIMAHYGQRSAVVTMAGIPSSGVTDQGSRRSLRMADAARDTIEKFHEAFNRRDLDALGDLITDDCVFAPSDAVWRMGGQWAPGVIAGHNDAAPYNAVWRGGRLAGFFDWDMAGPVSPAWDVAYAAFSWVPLHARHVVAREGFTGFEDRPRRLRLFLTEYGWAGSPSAFLDVVTARIQAHVTSLRDLAARDPLFARIVAQGGADDLETAVAELEHYG
jgi:thiamine kinase-like enzyme